MLLQGQETLSRFLPLKQRDDEGSPSFCGDTRYLEPLDTWGSPGGSAVKNTPAVQETWARSLGREDPLKQWHPTAVFLAGEFHGQSLEG